MDSGSHWAYLNVRSAHRGDFPAIVALLGICFADENKKYGFPADTLLSLASLEVQGFGLLVQKRGHLIVGFVAVDPGRRAACKLGVLRPWRSLGIGRQLMQAAERYSLQYRWEDLYVAVMEYASELVGYYTRLGYSDEGRRLAANMPEGYVGASQRMIVLRKSLTSGRAFLIDNFP